ncbi:hypothetical protein [Actinoplanes friuliensis]|uniref:Tat pathway signal sequence domain protein n=1 Tax=Actinoplanes friuliensis DSM 7358 TaxID=1246995 RepID=U5W8V7_9ACTN|nr:hypothetical protein [Actinoplanes friuliensis]AGZ45618.1 hypothetical protein AFR_36810 [Actinoplanes friuliensis DSM 7358]
MPTNVTSASGPLSRRSLLALPAAAAAATVAAPLLVPQSAAAAGSCAPRHLVDRSLAGPVGRACHYLDVVQDAYVKGGEPRLLQSYNNESELMTTAFVYDNALAALAYLANPTVANVRRARLIGDALLWIQDNDEKYTDGRVRQAYAAGPMLFYGGGPYFPGLKREDGKAAFLWPYGFGGSSTGDMAWVALALAQLYIDTRITKYLDGAVRLGHWIADRQSPYHYGGYHGGLQGDGETAQKWSSTEHNIDAYGLFALLAKLTKDRRWITRATEAGAFVRAMWNRTGGYYWTGTLGGVEGEDPNLVNTGNIPEDVQTWALLSVGERRHEGAVDWVLDNLSNTDGTVSGVTYSSQAKVLTGTVSGSTLPNNRNAVWLEGNGHTALALLKRDGRGDAARAKRLLVQTAVAQQDLGAGQTVGLTADADGGKLSNPGEGGTWTGTPLPARSGIVAATSAFDTGFAFGYFTRQHVGATSWFLMAAQNFNPYR